MTERRISGMRLVRWSLFLLGETFWVMREERRTRVRVWPLLVVVCLLVFLLMTFPLSFLVVSFVLHSTASVLVNAMLVFLLTGSSSDLVVATSFSGAKASLSFYISRVSNCALCIASTTKSHTSDAMLLGVLAG